MERIPLPRSGFGSAPKSNQFVLVTHSTCPPNFIRIRPQLFWDFLHKNKQTQGWKHNLLPPSVVEEIKKIIVSSTKSSQFILVTHPTCLPNFIRIRPQLFLDMLLTNRQTDRQGWKHNLHPPSVAGVIKQKLKAKLWLQQMPCTEQLAEPLLSQNIK